MYKLRAAFHGRAFTGEMCITHLEQCVASMSRPSISVMGDSLPAFHHMAHSQVTLGGPYAETLFVSHPYSVEWLL